MTRLAKDVAIHVMTADTHGTMAKEVDGGLPCRLMIIPENSQDRAKLVSIEQFDPQRVAAVGNDRNDCQMLERAAPGIAIVGREGASGLALMAADLDCTDITGAIDLLLAPKRLQTTLRN